MRYADTVLNSGVKISDTTISKPLYSEKRCVKLKMRSSVRLFLKNRFNKCKRASDYNHATNSRSAMEVIWYGCPLSPMHEEGFGLKVRQLGLEVWLSNESKSAKDYKQLAHSPISFDNQLL